MDIEVRVHRRKYKKRIEPGTVFDKTSAAAARPRKRRKSTGETSRAKKRGALLAASALALDIAATYPPSAWGLDITVNSQADLVNAVNLINASTDSSSTIRLGSSFLISVPLSLATRPVVLDTQGFTLTCRQFMWSGPSLTFKGTLQGIAGGGTGTGAGLQLLSNLVATTAVNDAVLKGGAATTGVGGSGAILNAASMTNNATIGGGDATTLGSGNGGSGVLIQRGAILTNNGTIQGGNSNGSSDANGIGVTYGVGGGAIINNSNASIRGGSDLTGANVGGAGIFVRAGASPIVNAGTIAGGNGAQAITANAAFSVVNSGTIQAGAGQADAIQFTGGTGALTLEVQAGSTIVGNVVANAASTSNVFRLGGTTNASFDISSIGASAQYRNFNTFEKTGTGTWALTGSGTASTPWTITQGTLQIGNGGTSGSTIGNIANNAALAFNRSDTFSFDNLVSGTGSVNQVGSGTTIITAANTYAGGTNVIAGSLAVGDATHVNASIGSGLATVSAGATLGGYGTVAGSVNNSGTVAAANALTAFASGSTGALRIGGDLNNAGTVNLAAASGQIGNVLNVGGNYVGQNGLVVLNTLLNQGGSASQTDRLAIGGNAGGTTAIKLNQSGSGALTIGDGIEVVQVAGASAANSFRLAGPVQAGAYQYLLYQGGTTDANDWYLRSQLAPPTTPGDAAATSPPSTPSTSPATAAPGPVAYRPAVIGYAMTPLLNVDYGFSVVGRLQERANDVASAQSAQSANLNGVWGRIGGQSVDANANDRFSADERTFFAQFGKDWTLSHSANGGSTHAGAMLTFGSTSASFSDSARSVTGSDATGTVETQAQSIGGYWTKYLPDGSYFDGVGQLTHYQNRYGDVFGGSGSQQGFGASASGEVGKPFAIGSAGMAIEPQAQLLYQYLHLNAFDDAISPISANTSNALRGRLGFKLFWANLSDDSKTSTATPYFTADVLHDFFSPGQVVVGGTPFANALAKTWYDIGVGMSGTFGKHSEVHANVKYEHSMGGAYRRNVFGQVGYRFSW